jgi:hypothetical protein
MISVMNRLLIVSLLVMVGVSMFVLSEEDTSAGSERKDTGGTWTYNGNEITITPIPRVSQPSDINITCKDKNGNDESVRATGGWTTPSNEVVCGGRKYKIICDNIAQRCYPQVNNAGWVNMVRVSKSGSGIKEAEG